MIRKATDKDIASIAVIYDLVLKQEEDGLTTIGWQRGVYPTEEVARQAVLRGDMYVLEDEKNARHLCSCYNQSHSGLCKQGRQVEH